MMISQQPCTYVHTYRAALNLTGTGKPRMSTKATVGKLPAGQWRSHTIATHCACVGFTRKSPTLY